MAKTTSGLATLNKKQSMSVEIPLPPLVQQEEVVNGLEGAELAASRLIAEIDEARASADRMFRAALRDVFSGRRLMPRYQAKVAPQT